MATYNVTLSESENTAVLDEQHIYGASRLGMKKPNILLYDNAPISYAPSDVTQNTLGETYFEISNYLGNVNAVITDRKIWNTTSLDYDAVVVSTADYYPFGMEMPGRFTNSGTYKYGYNGMEIDKEVSGNGNSYTTEFRQYDPRLGRWKSLDPLMAKFPWMSPYVAFDNNPIYYVDPYGLSSKGGPEKIDRTGNDSNSDSEKAFRTETLRDHMECGGKASDITFIYKNVPITGGGVGDVTYKFRTVTGASSQSIQESWSMTNQSGGLSHGKPRTLNFNEPEVLVAKESSAAVTPPNLPADDSNPNNGGKTSPPEGGTTTTPGGGTTTPPSGGTIVPPGGGTITPPGGGTITPPCIGDILIPFISSRDYFTRANKAVVKQVLRPYVNYLIANPNEHIQVNIFTARGRDYKPGYTWLDSDEENKYNVMTGYALSVCRYQTIYKMIRDMSNYTIEGPQIRFHDEYTKKKIAFGIKTKACK